MSTDQSTVQAAAIRELCKPLRLPTVAMQAVRLAEQAAKEKQGHLAFLEALLSAETEDREQNAVARRIKEAHFPVAKTLEEFIEKHPEYDYDLEKSDAGAQTTRAA